LTEYTYSADMAGLRYSLNQSNYGIQVRFQQQKKFPTFKLNLFSSYLLMDSITRWIF
jgi:hypothetical protein